MIINTAGEYTLQYTATDACGNSTTVQRDLVVDAPPRTVLYTDGTLIINELAEDMASNIALHGAANYVYAPFDPNGDTDVKKYIFNSISDQPWYSQRNSITAVEIGSNISPTSTKNWFNLLGNCTSIDVSKLDTSLVTDMNSMFSGCQSLTSLDVSGFDTSSVTDMIIMFRNCKLLTSLDLSNFNTSSTTLMSGMFNGCNALATLNLSGFDTSSVTEMDNMFYNCQSLTSLDLSGFNTSSVTVMSSMFNGCTALATIYASANFIVTQVTGSSSMFANMSTNLVGGAGTVWDSNYVNKDRAKIDGGSGNPGYFTAKS